MAVLHSISYLCATRSQTTNVFSPWPKPHTSQHNVPEPVLIPMNTSRFSAINHQLLSSLFLTYPCFTLSNDSLANRYAACAVPQQTGSTSLQLWHGPPDYYIMLHKMDLAMHFAVANVKRGNSATESSSKALLFTALI